MSKSEDSKELMVEILPEIRAVMPDSGSSMIDPAQEREHRLGEIHQIFFKDLVSIPSGADATLDGRNHLLLVHEGTRGETTASIQYNRGVRRGGGTTIFTHHAMSIVLGPDGILRGEKHKYKTATRPDSRRRVQRKEFPDTVEPLGPEDMVRFKRFASIAKEQLRNRPK